MALFVPQDPEFEARVRDSFASLTLMRTIGAGLLRLSPGEIEIDLPFSALAPSAARENVLSVR